MQQDPNSRCATGYPYPYPYPNPSQQEIASANGYPPNAYPYQNHNPYYEQQPDRRDILICRLFMAFMVFLIVLGLILIIFLIVVNPQLPNVYINTLSVSNFNVSNNRLTGNWDLKLQFQNPNSKMSLHYDSVFCILSYNSAHLSDTRLQPFDQGTKDETSINATLSVSGTYVEDRLADSIGKERASKGSVDFDLKMVYVVTLRYGVYRSRIYVRVYCENVAVGVLANSSSGNMIGSAKRCKPW